MVKGVNKTVIVVNNTGSKFFEKIVFYVTPEYGKLTAAQLQKATEGFTFSFGDEIPAKRSSLRKRYKRKRRVTAAVLLCGIFALLGIGLALIL